MTIDQYNTLLAAAPLIESALSQKNVHVVRPNYDADPGVAKASENTDVGADGTEQDEVTAGEDDGDDAEE